MVLKKMASGHRSKRNNNIIMRRRRVHTDFHAIFIYTRISQKFREFTFHSAHKQNTLNSVKLKLLAKLHETFQCSYILHMFQMAWHSNRHTLISGEREVHGNCIYNIYTAYGFGRKENFPTSHIPSSSLLLLL